MKFESIIEKIEFEFGGSIQISICDFGLTTNDLLADVQGLDCTSVEFDSYIREITRAEACILLCSTLHIGLAYNFEYMLLERALELAEAFLSFFGTDATFYSTTCIPDEAGQRICSWYDVISSHTFESVLYCVDTEKKALVLVVDED